MSDSIRVVHICVGGPDRVIVLPSGKRARSLRSHQRVTDDGKCAADQHRCSARERVQGPIRRPRTHGEAE